MPAPTQAQIKSLVAEFRDLTGASDAVAKRHLKATNYKLDASLEHFVQSPDNISRPSPLQGKLEALFETLRDDDKDEKDKMELESTMSYFNEKLGINIEDAELWLAIEVVQAPGVGEISKTGFVNGWKLIGVDATIEAQTRYLRHLGGSLATNPPLFKKVYRYAFVAGRERDQKSLSLENAAIYWTMLFTAPGWTWATPEHNWLGLWRRFLDEKWTRSVNKDMWNMLLEFAVKSREDQTLSFWTEDSAWPSVIDDFVKWCWENGVEKPESMAIDSA